MNSTQNLQQNVSLKNIENLDKKTISSPQKPTLNQNTTAPANVAASNGLISKEDRKHISKLLIAEVHFCRFLYKLLGRIK